MTQLLNFILLGFIGPQEIIIILIMFAAVSILPLIFYLLTVQNTLYEVSPENRKMPPPQVWLSLIPLFGIVWQFILINRVADSLQAEFAAKNIEQREARPGYSIGIAYCILFACMLIPILSPLTAIAGIICWIIYWVKINDYRLQLRNRKFYGQ